MTEPIEDSANPISQIIAAADEATEREELETLRAELQRLLQEGFKQSDAAESPFAPAIEMTDSFRDTYLAPSDGGVEAGFGDTIGGVAVDVANALANAERRVAFRIKTLFGFNGVRIVEEGDSWTQYPVFLEDIVDQLDTNKDFAIYSLGAAGDLVADMARKKEYLSALKTAKASAMLLSGGGNDLFGDLGSVLVKYTSGAGAEDLINEQLFAPVFNAVMSGYRTILSDVATRYPHVVIFGHGYDLPYPLDDGKWIGPALKANGIPFKLGREVLKVIMDRFNEALRALDASHRNFVYCDLRKKVGRGRNSWHDELHPKNPGYRRAAREIENAIRSRIVDGAEAATLATAENGPDGTPETARPIVLDPGHGGTEMVGYSSPNNAMGPNGTLEKHLTLDVVKRTRDILEDRGFTVLLTRETDENSGLIERAKVAKSHEAAVFVSVHFNASRAGEAQGTETFVHASLATGTGTQSLSLCRAIQAEMVAALGLRDRNEDHPGGIKSASLGVINPGNHAAGTAAVLHEVCFMDRADEEGRLAKVSYRRKIATALADGVETYLAGSMGAARVDLAQEEVGDAIELASLHDSLGFADTAATGPVGAAPTPVSDPAPPAPMPDVSNGHMIADSGLTENFLKGLASGAARHVGPGDAETGILGEGPEPSDHDPKIESVFGSMSADAQANLHLLQGLFAGVDASGFDLAAFEAFIRNLNLRYFSAAEFLVLGNKNKSGPCQGKNALPSRSLWPNIGNTALLIDEIRHRLNAPVFISSAYRSPDYNACIGGVENSLHMRFNALDWRCSSGSPAEWLSVARDVQSSQSNFAGFSDDYPTFVHIDTRHA